MSAFNLTSVDPSWQPCVMRGLKILDADYLKSLQESDHWLPGPQHIFNALNLPLEKVNYVLFGESPYPRRESAIGYAFRDGAVNEIWSTQGLSKKVNRATSLRNIIKMLLVAEGVLTSNDTSQEAIAKINKENFVQTNEELFNNFHHHGFLLLNACLVLQTGQKIKDAREWRPFIKELLNCLIDKKPDVTLLFFGRIAFTIEKLLEMRPVKKISVEHPYNLSFINNKQVLDFFQPLHLLRAVKK